MKYELLIMESFGRLSEILMDYLTGISNNDIINGIKIGVSGDKEEVTNIDENIEKLSITFLNNNFREIPIIAEERYNRNDPLPDKGWVFVIDPIDGTAEFIKGSSEWSISVAAIYNYVPRVAMLLVPRKSLLLLTSKRSDILCNGKVFIPPQKRSRTQFIAVSPRQIQTPEYLNRIKISGYSPMPIPTFTIKIVSMILGQVDAAIYFSQNNKSANIWDYAAAVLFLEKNGGKITTLNGFKLPFGKNSIINTAGWLATNKTCNHEKLLSIFCPQENML
jgi:3'-phosphoadenosine 5'-phosphosulfate (PAPS) 3'-phosphatase